MDDNNMLEYLSSVVENIPNDWLRLTTHRLDIYDEKNAKTDFLNEFKALLQKNIFDTKALNALPTAYDYIRLGHPLSCVLEWAIASKHHLEAENVISFSTQTMPILAILRNNLLEKKETQILYTDELPSCFDSELLERVYGYNFQLKKVKNGDAIPSFEGSTIFLLEKNDICHFDLFSNIDFYINYHPQIGSIVLINDEKGGKYISEIQHVRRRETIAMTPANCLIALKSFIQQDHILLPTYNTEGDKTSVINTIKEITQAHTNALVGSSGLSIQYAIMMGVIDHAQENYKGKDIKFVVPPNCYGGTNDQARRVAACLDNVEVVDLPVDGDHDMVQSINIVLDEIAAQDAIPCIIAEIPTNPRVEVPDMIQLKDALAKERKTSTGQVAVDPLFILDQTFCPNVHFLGEGQIRSLISAISYASGSKFPSGGLCTAGYVVGNKKVEALISKIELHLNLCDNEATPLQYEILAKQLPSMNQRIEDAYKNTREFVNYIKEILPDARINFVSEELASHGFTPSVFSLDLPTKGATPEEKESYKRALNHKLINLMITEIPNESKYCVSYGQLKGCYWTIPATSTQGTTKEGDKDYIARVAVSPNLDLETHKKVFNDFVKEI